jgi:hypothetical protein
MITTQKTVQTTSGQLLFNYKPDARCWQQTTPLWIEGNPIEVEIDLQFYKQAEIDWLAVADFVEFIQKEGLINNLIKSNRLDLLTLGKTFFRNSSGVAKWNMYFSNAVYFNGLVNSNGNLKFVYSLIFNYTEQSNEGTYGDEYGLYLLECEGVDVTRKFRHQC